MGKYDKELGMLFFSFRKIREGVNIGHVGRAIEEKDIEVGSVFLTNAYFDTRNQYHTQCFGECFIFSCPKKGVVSGNRKDVNVVLVRFDNRIVDCIIDKSIVEIASSVAVKITEKIHWTLSVKGG